MQIFVLLQNVKYNVKIDSAATILDLRDEIAVQTQILQVEVVDEIIPLEGTGFCSENGIQDGSVIYLSVTKSFLDTYQPVTIGNTTITPKTMSFTTTSNVVTISKDLFESWDCDQLCVWLTEMKIVEETIATCRDNQLDGLSLLHSTYTELVNDMKIKPGAAKKLCVLVEKIKGGSQDRPIPVNLPSQKEQRDPLETIRQQKFIKFEDLKIGTKIGSGGEATIFVGIILVRNMPLSAC
jgi:hypothetical protein